MSLTSIGDLARGFVLQRQTAALKAETVRLSSELVTGQASDPARALRGEIGPLAAIETSLARIAGWQNAAAGAGLRLDAMQAALAVVDDAASGLGAALALASSPGNPQLLATAAADARGKFATVIGALNARAGDQSLFAGPATAGPALAPAETILADLAAATAGATSAANIAAAVDHWFDDPAGFQTQAWRGSSAPAGPVPVGPGESLHIGATAADPALRETLKGLAMAALLDTMPLAGAARADLAGIASERLLGAAPERAGLAARLGVAQGALAAAETRNAAEATGLGIARQGLTGADPYAVAVELESAQTQLETVFAVTARLSRLSLADFLR